MEDFENNDQKNFEPGPDSNGKLKTAFSPVGAALLGLVSVFILYQFGGAILTILILGLDFKKADVNALRLLTTAGQILFILLPALIFAKYVYADVSSALRIKLPKLKEIGLFTLGLIILTPLLQSFLYIQNFLFDILADNVAFFGTTKRVLDELDKLVESTYDNLLSAHSFFEASFIVFIVAVVPAVCEEVFFRGFVQTGFEQKYKPFIAILFTALFFGLYHFNPYGLISLIALGAYFGYAAYKSDSILVPISLHFINNFLSVMAFFAIGDKELLSSGTTKTESIYLYIISFVVLSAVFSFFIYHTKRKYDLKGG
jgi:uncharacterized protein